MHFARTWHSSKPAAVAGWGSEQIVFIYGSTNALYLVTFDRENETRVVGSSLSPAIAVFLDKTSIFFLPLEVAIRTASRKMTRFYDYET